MPAKSYYQRLAFTFLIGVVGALAAHVVRLPIPWLLGSMLLCAVAQLVRVPLQMPPARLERIMRVVVGVTLGPAVAASLLHNAADLPLAILSATLVTTVMVVIGTLWFRRYADVHDSSAFLMSLPGGLSMLLAMAGDVGNRPQVLFVHTVRVFSLLIFVSLLARFLGVSSEHGFISMSFDINTTSSWLLLFALVAVGYLLSENLKIPGAHVLLPMGLTAALVITTPLVIDPPELFKTVAMLVFGCVLGLEIAAGPKATYSKLLGLSLAFTATAIALGAGFAWGLSYSVSPSFLVLFLALAPGGIAEVSLVALALGLDVGLVALIHACRFLFIVVAGPLGLGVIRKKSDVSE
ncbi:MAG: AbrB family transcriptional regulator [Granulosicoccus sp.]|nr:AbrB family transcriptional regulator [Granulosicoccus sp.]